MAILEAPSELHADLRPEEIPAVPALPDSDAAVKLVVKDLNRAEYYLLAKGLTVEWDKDDRLYLFRMPQAFWEGSSVPRSSLGMPLCLEHIEATMRQVMPALFPDDTGFLCEPKPKTSRDAADACKDILSFQLKNCGFREETRLGVKCGTTYGTGIWKAGWRVTKTLRRTWQKVQPDEVMQTTSGTIKSPAKGGKLKATIEEIVMGGPVVENCYIRHVITSPDLRVPDIRKSSYVVHRTYPTMQDLDNLRNEPGFDIPPMDDLLQLMMPPKEMPERSMLEGRSTSSVMNTGISSLDINMEFRAMPRWQDATADPNRGKLEMLEYWTKERVIYVLNRKLCLKNDINPYGRIPFFSVCYIDVLDSFYGIGICKLIGGEQRLQQGVINSRLDDLALRLSGTFLRMRGSNTPTQQLRLRPGGIIDSDDEKGVQMIQYPPAIADAFTEVEASDARSARRTSANSAVTQGQMPSTGQLGRTATGMDTIAAGVGAAMGYFVDSIVDSYYIPLLEFFHEMNCDWLEPEDIDRILTEELAEAYEMDAMQIKNARLTFSMQAGTRMRAKQAMAQQLMGLIQILQQSAVQESLQDQGKKTNWAKTVQMFYDTTDWPGEQEIVEDMTDEDKQRMAQKAQAAQQMSIESQKHGHRMGEIEQKGVAQMATKIVESILKSMSPEDRMKWLQIQQTAMDSAAGQENDRASNAGESDNGGQQPAGQ